MPFLVAAALLGVSAVVINAVPRGHATLCRCVGAFAALAAGSVILASAAVARVPFHLDAYLGNVLPGIDLSLRATPTAVALIAIVAGAAMLALGNGARRTAELPGLLIGLLGTILIVLAGNLVVATAGLAVVTASAVSQAHAEPTPDGATPQWRRSGTFLIGSAALGLLLVAVAQLIGQQGTTDFTSLPPGVLHSAIALPWALAAMVCLGCPVAASVLGRNGVRRLDWMGVTMIPAGIALLLHLIDAASGDVGSTTTVTLGIAAALFCVGASAAALAGSGTPMVLAWLVVAAGGGILAAAAFGNSARLAFAVAALSCELLVVAAAGWQAYPEDVETELPKMVAKRRLGVVVGVFSAVVGFGAPTALLVISSASQDGRIGARWLAGALAVGAVFAGGAAALVVRGQLAAQLSSPSQGWPTMGITAWLAALPAVFAALFPGWVVAVVATLVAAPPPNADIFSLSTPVGSWLGGYVTAAVALTLVLAWSVITIAGTSGALKPSWAAMFLGPGLRHSAAPSPPVAAAPRSTAAARIAAGMRRTDTWLQSQPQLGTTLVVAAVALLLIR